MSNLGTEQDESKTARAEAEVAYAELRLIEPMSIKVVGSNSS